MVLAGIMGGGNDWELERWSHQLLRFKKTEV